MVIKQKSYEHTRDRDTQNQQGHKCSLVVSRCVPPSQPPILGDRSWSSATMWYFPHLDTMKGWFLIHLISFKSQYIQSTLSMVIKQKSYEHTRDRDTQNQQGHCRVLLSGHLELLKVLT